MARGHEEETILPGLAYKSLIIDIYAGMLKRLARVVFILPWFLPVSDDSWIPGFRGSRLLDALETLGALDRFATESNLRT